MAVVFQALFTSRYPCLRLFTSTVYLDFQQLEQDSAVAFVLFKNSAAQPSLGLTFS